MGLIKKIGKFFTNTWKDLTDPGRHARAELQTLQQQELARRDAELAEQKRQREELTKKAEQVNAMNESWGAQYLHKLQELPSLTYNQGVTALERGIVDTQEALTRRMANLGISGSGVDLAALANVQGARARGISALQGEKLRNEADTASKSFNLMSGLGQSAMSNLMDAYNLHAGNMGAGNSILQQYMSQLSQDANRQSPFMQLLPTLIGGMFGGAGGAAASGAMSGSGSNPGSGYNPALQDLQFKLLHF